MARLCNLKNDKENIHDRINSGLSEMTLLGSFLLDNAKNIRILNGTIQYIFVTKRFDVPLINSWKFRKVQ